MWIRDKNKVTRLIRIRRLQTIAELQDLQRSSEIDTALKHKKADCFLCKFLTCLGYADIVYEYEKIKYNPKKPTIMKELKETVDMMVSEDYKERFKAEYYQVKIRLEKLQRMVVKWDDGELPFTPTCPRKIYDGQLHIMHRYIDILEERAQIEGIEL